VDSTLPVGRKEERKKKKKDDQRGSSSISLNPNPFLLLIYIMRQRVEKRGGKKKRGEGRESNGSRNSPHLSLFSY